MEKKYPVLKCDAKLWKEIKPALESFGITDFDNVDYFDKDYSYLVCNYGDDAIDEFKIGITWYGDKGSGITDRRYLVDTKEAFLYAVAKLLSKEGMEERNIKVSLEKAREWYKSDNVTLKELALQAYSKEELCQYLEEGHRVMVSDDGKIWGLKEYYKDNNAKNMSNSAYYNWNYIVPAEDFDFTAEDISVNIKKSVV